MERAEVVDDAVDVEQDEGRLSGTDDAMVSPRPSCRTSGPDLEIPANRGRQTTVAVVVNPGYATTPALEPVSHPGCRVGWWMIG